MKLKHAIIVEDDGAEQLEFVHVYEKSIVLALKSELLSNVSKV